MHFTRSGHELVAPEHEYSPEKGCAKLEVMRLLRGKSRKEAPAHIAGASFSSFVPL